jgi:hypothetical protein
MFSRKKVGCFVTIIASVALSFSCSARPSDALQSGRIVNYTNCQLPPDQGAGSFQAGWASLPIPLVLDKDFYVADEGEAIEALKGSIETWNIWSRLRGLEAFNLTSDGTGQSAGRDIPEITSCDQAAYSAAVTDVVGIWKISNNGFHRNARPTCNAIQKKILPDGVQGQTDWIVQSGKVVGASILLNFEGFNAPGKQLIDVESLLLHELGHVLGLLHSCNGSSGDSVDGTSSPACGTAPQQYIDAVMFPFLEVAQQRRALLQNDYNRINCLY